MGLAGVVPPIPPGYVLVPVQAWNQAQIHNNNQRAAAPPEAQHQAPPANPPALPPQAATSTWYPAPPHVVNFPMYSLSVGFTTGHTLDIEPFDPRDGHLWFARFEASLDLAHLTGDRRTSYLIRALPQEWASAVHRHLQQYPAGQGLYEAANALLLGLIKPTAQHTKSLFHLPPLGKRKPSELMKQMRMLMEPGSKFIDFHLLHYLSRLPTPLAAPYDGKRMVDVGGDENLFALSLDLEWAAMQDFVEATSPTVPGQRQAPDAFMYPANLANQGNIGPHKWAITTRVLQSLAAAPAATPAAALQPLIQSFAQKNEARPSGRSQGHRGGFRRDNQRQNSSGQSGFNNNTNQQQRSSRGSSSQHSDRAGSQCRTGLCYYHDKFGSNAHKREGNGCSFKAQVNQADSREDNIDLSLLQRGPHVDSANSADALQHWYQGKDKYPSVPQRTIIMCKMTNILFLIDTGACLSFVPLKMAREQKFNQVELKKPISVTVANGENVKISQGVEITIDLGFGSFKWKFFTGDLNVPIIGHDLLSHFDILVRPANRSILSPKVNQKINPCTSRARRPLLRAEEGKDERRLTPPAPTHNRGPEASLKTGESPPNKAPESAVFIHSDAAPAEPNSQCKTIVALPQQIAD